MSLTNAKLFASITGDYSRPAGLGSKLYSINYAVSKTLIDGTGTGAADLLVQLTHTLAASANEDLDLAGVIADAIGDTTTLVKIKALLIYADAANTNDVVVGGAPANAWAGWWGATTNTAKVPPDGTLMHTHPGAGWTVTAGTGDLLRVANGGAGTSVTYTLVIVGASA